MLKANNNYGIFRKTHWLFFIYIVYLHVVHKAYVTKSLRTVQFVYIPRMKFSSFVTHSRSQCTYIVWYTCTVYVYCAYVTNDDICVFHSSMCSDVRQEFWHTYLHVISDLHTMRTMESLLVGVQCSWISWGTSNLRLRPRETAKLWQSMNIGSQE